MRFPPTCVHWTQSVEQALRRPPGHERRLISAGITRAISDEVPSLLIMEPEHISTVVHSQLRCRLQGLETLVSCAEPPNTASSGEELWELAKRLTLEASPSARAQMGPTLWLPFASLALATSQLVCERLQLVALRPVMAPHDLILTTARLKRILRQPIAGLSVSQQAARALNVDTWVNWGVPLACQTEG